MMTMTADQPELSLKFSQKAWAFTKSGFLIALFAGAGYIVGQVLLSSMSPDFDWRMWPPQVSTWRESCLWLLGFVVKSVPFLTVAVILATWKAGIAAFERTYRWAQHHLVSETKPRLPWEQLAALFAAFFFLGAAIPEPTESVATVGQVVVLQAGAANSGNTAAASSSDGTLAFPLFYFHTAKLNNSHVAKPSITSGQEQIVRSDLRALLSCRAGSMPVGLKVEGFASWTLFSNKSQADSDVLNMNAANVRAQTVHEYLQTLVKDFPGLELANVAPWQTPDQMMKRRRELIDKGAIDGDADLSAVQRVVVLTATNTGGCQKITTASIIADPLKPVRY